MKEKKAESVVVVTDDIFIPPIEFSNEEKIVWENITKVLQTTTHYKKTEADRELVRQYCQLTVMRNRAWEEYNKKPERYMRIVVGICGDGKTPKVLVKENEHYKTLLDCNKHIEKLLNDLRLSPLVRAKRFY